MKSPSKQSIKFSFIGDLVIKGNYMSNQIENDMSSSIELIKSYLSDSDIKVATLAAPIRNFSEKIISISHNQTIDPDYDPDFHLKTDYRLLNEIVNSIGFNVLTIRNNDYLPNDMDVFNVSWVNSQHSKKMKIDYCWIEISAYDISDSKYLNSYKKIKMIEQLLNSDPKHIKIVLLHSDKPKKIQEIHEQKKFAFAAIEAGAEIVIFNHLYDQGNYEIFKNKYIIYGLGDLLMNTNSQTAEKNFYLLQFELSQCKKIENLTLSPIN